MTDGFPAELVAVCNSPRRLEVLAFLAEGPATKRRISSVTDIPRTTLRSNLDTLLEHGLVEEHVHKEFRLTSLGRAMYETVASFVERADAIVDSRPFLRDFDVAETGFESAWFERLTIRAPAEADPRRPMRALAGRIRDAETVRVAMPVFLPALLDVLVETASDGDRLLVTRSVRDLLRERETDGGEAVSDSPVEVTVSSGPDFVPVLADERTCLLALTADRRPGALAETMDGEIRTWAASVLAD